MWITLWKIQDLKFGKTYTTGVDLNVRTGAGTNYSIKKYSELTEDGKKHAYKQTNAVLKKGTRVTCLETKIENNNIWIRIPSRLDCRFLSRKNICRII